MASSSRRPHGGNKVYAGNNVKNSTNTHFGDIYNNGPITQQTVVKETNKERLFRSLDYPQRNERLNLISDVQGNSFQRLVGRTYNKKDSDSEGDASSEEARDSREEESYSEEDDSSGQHDADLGSANSEEGSKMDLKLESDAIYQRLMKACRGTASDSFTSWLETKDQQLYWISAKPASGKSTLMKFLYNHPRTVALLFKSARKPPITIFHSFYLMGTNKLQSDIKGMWYNILCQILEADDGCQWADQLFLAEPTILRKGRADSTSWSTEKLLVALHALLEIITKTHSVCFFLDGLDEVHNNDGKIKLRKELKEFRVKVKLNHQIKFCVSSRPEVEFVQEISWENVQTLKLDTLTRGDIYEFALGLLYPVSPYCPMEGQQELVYTWDHKRRLAEMIVEKADGVFLWADVASRALQRAITNNDKRVEVDDRLNAMPTKMNELFHFMWKRHGDDESLYKQEAALCFNLVLDNANHCNSSISYGCRDEDHRGKNQGRDEHNEACNNVDSHNTITLYQLVLAVKDVHTYDRTGSGSHTEPETQLAFSELERFYNRLPIVSAGLLEFFGPLYPAYPVKVRKDVSHVGPGLRTLHRTAKYADPDVRVRFVHRTAKEFFGQSIEGREILKSDNSWFELRFRALIQAKVDRCSTFQTRLTGELYFPEARIDIIELLSDVHSAYIQFERGLDVVTRPEEEPGKMRKRLMLDALSACHELNTNPYGGSYCIESGKCDFLVLCMDLNSLEYVKYVSRDHKYFTSEYKNHILVNGIWSMEWCKDTYGDEYVPPNLGNWHTRLEIINYLLSWVDKFEPSYVRAKTLFRATGLEAFIGSLWAAEVDGVFASDKKLCDLAIKTLKVFAEKGANFLQPLYGYYIGTRLSSNLYSCHFENHNSWTNALHGNCMEIPILLEMSITEILRNMIDIRQRHTRQNENEIPYFYQQLREFINGLKVNPESTGPRVIAVGPPVTGDWIHKAKVVPNHKQSSLLKIVLSSWIFRDDMNWKSRWTASQKDLQKCVNEIMTDNTIPTGIEDYLMHVCGFQNSLPSILEDLIKMGFLKRLLVLQVLHALPGFPKLTGVDKLPEHPLLPPVKYKDQINLNPIKGEGRRPREGTRSQYGYSSNIEDAMMSRTWRYRPHGLRVFPTTTIDEEEKDEYDEDEDNKDEYNEDEYDEDEYHEDEYCYRKFHLFHF